MQPSAVLLSAGQHMGMQLLLYLHCKLNVPLTRRRPVRCAAAAVSALQPQRYLPASGPCIAVQDQKLVGHFLPVPHSPTVAV